LVSAGRAAMSRRAWVTLVVNWEAVKAPELC
jgi:hypothetical protein